MWALVSRRNKICKACAGFCDGRGAAPYTQTFSNEVDLVNARLPGGHAATLGVGPTGVIWRQTASRDDGLPPANRREHVIPALTDHLEDKGGVIGAEISQPSSGFFKPFCRTLCGYAFRGLVVIYRSH